MTPEQTVLARKLVAHPRWDWQPGMRWFDPYQEERGHALVPGGTVTEHDWNHPKFGPGHLCLPNGVLLDLTDDATGGVLLSMLQKDVGKALMVSSDLPGAWEVMSHDIGSGQTYFCEYGATLAEACARALLALWEDK